MFFLFCIVFFVGSFLFQSVLIILLVKFLSFPLVSFIYSMKNFYCSKRRKKKKKKRRKTNGSRKELKMIDVGTYIAFAVDKACQKIHSPTEGHFT